MNHDSMNTILYTSKVLQSTIMNNPYKHLLKIRNGMFILFIILSIGFIISPGISEPLTPPENTTDPSLPFYFIAVHNEPYHGTFQQEQKLKAAYAAVAQKQGGDLLSNLPG